MAMVRNGERRSDDDDPRNRIGPSIRVFPMFFKETNTFLIPVEIRAALANNSLISEGIPGDFFARMRILI